MYEQKVRETIGALRLGAPMSDGPLSILPLRSVREGAARYVLPLIKPSPGTLLP